MTPQTDKTTLSRILSGRMQEIDLDSLSPDEWDLLVRTAQVEGVAPLLYWVLSGAGKISCLPKPLQNSLRAMYFSTRMNNEQIVKELESLGRSFAQADIPVVALKGICYALTIYPDIGLRPMVDLDVLVPVSRFSAAVQTARSSGYVDAVPEASPGLRDLLSHEVCLKKTGAPFTTLEIHHSLVADKSFRYAVPVDWFWSQTEPLDALPSYLQVLTPTAQVLYACGHAMLQHGGRNTTLRWVYDLDRLIRAHAGRMDWDLLLSQARRFEWTSAVSGALLQTLDLFDTPIPPNVLEYLSKRSDRNTEWVEMMRSQPASHTLEEYQKLKSLNGVGRLRLILALALPSPAYMRWRYGLRSAWVLPAYYIYRWWGILKDGLMTAWMLIHKAVMQISH